MVFTMKVILIAFVALAIGANAIPRDYEVENLQRNPINDRIEQGLENAMQSLRDNGYDPWQVHRHQINTTPQPGLVINFLVEEFTAIGASNMKIRRVDFNVFLSRLRLDFDFPEISASLDKSTIDVDYHGDKYSAELSGDFILRDLSVTSETRVNIGIISGITVTSVDVRLRFGFIWADFVASYQGEDESARLNNLINVEFPRWFSNNQAQIDRTLSNFVKDIANRLLN